MSVLKSNPETVTKGKGWRSVAFVDHDGERLSETLSFYPNPHQCLRVMVAGDTINVSGYAEFDSETACQTVGLIMELVSDLKYVTEGPIPESIDVTVKWNVEVTGSDSSMLTHDELRTVLGSMMDASKEVF